MSSQLQKKLLLILGAGASAEIGLPIGKGLKKDISKQLSYHIERGDRLREGNEKIYQALSHMAHQSHDPNHLMQKLVDACGEIQNSMPLAPSIDNYIHSRSDNPNIAIVGKLSITESIIRAEKSSTLFSGNPNRNFDFNTIEDTWYGDFFKLLTSNASLKYLPDRLRQISIVSFNYDRCIEHFLLISLKQYYAINDEQAKSLIGNIEIYHPYGMAGKLNWMSDNPDERCSYGGTLDFQKLIKLSQQIRTFTETANSEIIQSIKHAFIKSENVVFLGLAYHPMNIQLLFERSDNVPNNLDRQMYGTSHGLSNNYLITTRDTLAYQASVAHSRIRIESNLDCRQLFHEYGATLFR